MRPVDCGALEEKLLKLSTIAARGEQSFRSGVMEACRTDLLGPW